MNCALVLVDLDETLLPTELLRDARHSGHPIDLAQFAGYNAIRLYSGIAESLDALASVTRVGLVTSSPRWYVERILADHLPDFVFDVQITYDDVDNIKPHPEPLNLALSTAQVSPDRAVYVGDADLDFDACAAAGLDFIGAGWSANRTYPFVAQSAHTPQELVELIVARP